MCHELGMGALVLGPERLPNLNPSDEISEHLGHNYGTVCETADGFAQVSTTNREVADVRLFSCCVGRAPPKKRAEVRYILECRCSQSISSSLWRL
jgi:hypothetical protein